MSGHIVGCPGLPMTEVPDFLLKNPKHPSAVSLSTGATSLSDSRKSVLDGACSPLARRAADKFLKRPAECGFGFIADIMGDSGNLDAGIRKSLGSNRHAPLAQVLGRRPARDFVRTSR